MKQATANVVIHFPGTPDEQSLGEAQRAMCTLEGVTRVVASPRLRGLVLVDYDPGAISAQTILAGAARGGLAGRLVGL